MSRLVKFGTILVATLAALAVWAGLVVYGASAGWLRTPLAPRGDADAFLSAAAAKIDARNEGNAALLMLDDGRVVGMHFATRGAQVDGDTLFQVASLSKWITAWGVMALVQDGKLDLDAPVSRYLTRWHLPPSDYDNEQVTVRRLLSHTAGLTDGLGYGGFAPGTPVQSLEDSLTHASDASPGRDRRVRVGAEPGSTWEYSGGGYTLLQLLIEEVSGESFNDYMRRRVLAPLGMTRSTFVVDDTTTNVASFYDRGGKPATHYRFTALAAASLYTSVNDMSRFLQANASGGGGVLTPQTLEAMREPTGFQYGIPIWGLGLILIAPTADGGYVIGHDGMNGPAINTAARIDPATGDGIVVLESGSPILATEVAADWVFWDVGAVDFLDIVRNIRTILLVLAGGALAILIAAIAAVFLWKRRPKPA